MAVIKNRELVQSYVLTTAKYDFSVYEKRVLYRIVEVLQAYLTGLKLNYNYSVQEALYKDADTEFSIELKAFLKGEADNNYEEVKKALKSLRNKTFEFETPYEWGVYGIIESPKIKKCESKKYESFVTFKVTPLLLYAFMNFAKGFRKFELKIAMSLESTYSMRLYELMSKQKKPITYSIEELKSMFKVEKKYKDNNRFISQTIKVAKEELDNKSPYTFNIKENRGGRGGKINSITFIPIYQPQFNDTELETHILQQQVSSRWTLSRQEVEYLSNNFGFTEDELRKNTDTFKDINAVTDLLNELARIKAKINELNAKGKGISNVKGYVITSLRNSLTKIVERAQGGTPGSPGDEPTAPPQEPTPTNPMAMLTGLADKKRKEVNI